MSAAGAGRPIVLLHGCGGSAASTFVATGWLEAIEGCGRRAMAPDLPGHGSREASRDPADYRDLAGLLLPRLPAGPFDGIGFSLGAKLLLELALRIPRRVARLVLGGIGDNVFAAEQVAGAAAHALEAGPGPDTPTAVRAFLETWEPERNDALAVAAVLRRPANPVFTPERLRKLDCPVLIVNGELDPVARAGTRLASSLPGSRTVVISGAGHFDLPRQEKFIREALDFLGASVTQA